MLQKINDLFARFLLRRVKYASQPVRDVFEPITKIEPYSAAVDQLETAICLYFLGESRCSVHTLAGAAQEVLNGLRKNAHRKNPSLAPSPQNVLDRFDAAEFMGTKDWNEIRNALKHFQGQSNSERTLDDLKNLVWLADAVKSADDLGWRESHVVALLVFWVQDARKNLSWLDSVGQSELISKQTATQRQTLEAPQTIWARDMFKRWPFLQVPSWFKNALLR